MKWHSRSGPSIHGQRCDSLPAPFSDPPVDISRLAPVGEMVDPKDLIGAAEVQAILKLSHPSSVTTYLKRYEDFPRPVVNINESRVRLWRRQDILRWRDAREARS